MDSAVRPGLGSRKVAKGATVNAARCMPLTSLQQPELDVLAAAQIRRVNRCTTAVLPPLQRQLSLLKGSMHSQTG